MKILIIVIIIGLITYGGYMLLKSNAAEDASKIVLDTEPLEQKAVAERELAIAAANDLFRIKKLEGTSFSSGPCLSNKIIPGWVFDIAHNPREEIDNQPENQCADYQNGTAKHFVEFDPQGNLIQAQ